MTYEEEKQWADAHSWSKSNQPDSTPAEVPIQKRYNELQNVEQQIGYTFGWADAIEWKDLKAIQKIVEAYGKALDEGRIIPEGWPDRSKVLEVLDKAWNATTITNNVDQIREYIEEAKSLL